MLIINEFKMLTERLVLSVFLTDSLELGKHCAGSCYERAAEAFVQLPVEQEPRLLEQHRSVEQQHRA